MPKITEENMYDGCDFTCGRCNTKVQRVSQLEPELGYVGKLTGEFTQVCEKCWNELPDKDKAMKPVFEAMFVVCIRSNGEAPLITEEGITQPYKRSPTPFEIKSSCKEVATQLDSMEITNKVAGFVMQTLQQGQQGNNSMVLPRKR